MGRQSSLPIAFAPGVVLKQPTPLQSLPNIFLQQAMCFGALLAAIVTTGPTSLPLHERAHVNSTRWVTQPRPHCLMGYDGLVHIEWASAQVPPTLPLGRGWQSSHRLWVSLLAL